MVAIQNRENFTYGPVFPEGRILELVFPEILRQQSSFVEIAGFTKPKSSEPNEDAIGLLTEFDYPGAAFAALVDGMGGRPAGQVASYLVRQTACQEFRDRGITFQSTPIEVLTAMKVAERQALGYFALVQNLVSYIPRAGLAAYVDRLGDKSPAVRRFLRIALEMVEKLSPEEFSRLTNTNESMAATLAFAQHLEIDKQPHFFIGYRGDVRASALYETGLVKRLTNESLEMVEILVGMCEDPIRKVRLRTEIIDALDECESEIEFTKRFMAIDPQFAAVEAHVVFTNRHIINCTSGLDLDESPFGGGKDPLNTLLVPVKDGMIGILLQTDGSYRRMNRLNLEKYFQEYHAPDLGMEWCMKDALRSGSLICPNNISSPTDQSSVSSDDESFVYMLV